MKEATMKKNKDRRELILDGQGALSFYALQGTL